MPQRVLKVFVLRGNGTYSLSTLPSGKYSLEVRSMKAGYITVTPQGDSAVTVTQPNLLTFVTDGGVSIERDGDTGSDDVVLILSGSMSYSELAAEGVPVWFLRPDGYIPPSDPVGDTTAPTLSSPSGDSSGATSASGTVVTNEVGGILYAFISQSVTPPSISAMKAGSGAVFSTSQSVPASGLQAVSITGLVEGESYYVHFLQTDEAGNDSNIASSSSFIPTAGATATPYADAVNALGPIAYYKLQENSPSGAGSVADEIGTFGAASPTGTFEQFPGATKDANDKSMRMVSEDSFILMPDALRNALTATATWSLSFWLYMEPDTSGSIVSLKGNAKAIGIGAFSGSLASTSSDGGDAGLSNGQARYGWRHIVLTSEGRIYADKAQASSGPGAPAGNGNVFHLFNRNDLVSYGEFKGMMSHFAVYDKVLTATEVGTLHDAGRFATGERPDQLTMSWDIEADYTKSAANGVPLHWDYYPDRASLVSTAKAHSGVNSILIDGQWDAAKNWHDVGHDAWMPLGEGTIEFYVNFNELPATSVLLGADPVGFIRLVWQDNSDNEDGFEIWRGWNGDGDFELIGTTGTDEASFSDPVPQHGVFAYKVLAFNEAGRSGFSNTLIVDTQEDPSTTPETSPETPSNLNWEFIPNE